MECNVYSLNNKRQCYYVIKTRPFKLKTNASNKPTKSGYFLGFKLPIQCSSYKIHKVVHF